MTLFQSLIKFSNTKLMNERTYEQMNEWTTKSYCSLTAHVFTITDFFRFVNESKRHECSCENTNTKKRATCSKQQVCTLFLHFYVILFLPVDRLGNRDDDIEWGKVNWSADKVSFFEKKKKNFQSQSRMESNAVRLYTVCHTNVSKFNFHWQLMGLSNATAIELIDHLWAIWPYSHCNAIFVSIDCALDV